MNLIRNLRRLKSLAVFSIASGLILALTVSGQATRQQQQQQPEQNKQDPQKPKPAQEPDAPAIRIDSNLVAGPGSVTDNGGNPVRKLTGEGSQPEEEGVKRQLAPLGEPGNTPLELALLFDVARSIRNRFDFEGETAGRFLKEVLNPGDAVSIFSSGSA